MDTYATMRPINFLLKCFALNCICKKDNKIISSWSLIKNLLIISILCPMTSIVFFKKYQETDVKKSQFSYTDVLTIVFFLSFLKYVIDLVYVWKYGKKNCVNYYYAYDKIDGILKTNNYNEIKSTCFKIIVFSFAFLIFSITVDNLAWRLTVANIDIQYIQYSIGYFYNFAQILVILDIVSHVIQIEYRSRRFGDIVEKFNKNNKAESKCGTVSRNVNSEATRLDRLKILKVRAKDNNIWSPDDIPILNQCYLMLIKQTEFINTMFGFRVSISKCFTVFIN